MNDLHVIVLPEHGYVVGPFPSFEAAQAYVNSDPQREVTDMDIMPLSTPD